MIRPRWLAHLLARLGGYFWLPCPNCGRNFSGFEIGKYMIGFDAHGRRFRVELGGIVWASMGERRADIPEHWSSCCKDCDIWLPVRWWPLEPGAAYHVVCDPALPEEEPKP